MSIQSNRQSRYGCPAHAAFLDHLAYGALSQGRIPQLQVTTQLQPPTDFGMQGQQHRLRPPIDDKCTGRDVAHRVGSPHAIVMGVDELAIFLRALHLNRIRVLESAKCGLDVRAQIHESANLVGFVRCTIITGKTFERVGDRPARLRESQRIVEVLRSGQQVRVRPQGVAGFGAAL